MNNNNTIIKISVTIIALLCISSKVFSIPAYPHKVKVKTSDGEDVEIYMRGDENNKFACTLDGYTLLSDSIGWWYATLSVNGDVEKSSFRLMAKENKTEAFQDFKSSCPKGLIPNTKDPEVRYAYRSEKDIISITGERRALVVLMQYRDVDFKKSNEDFYALFNELNYNKDDAKGSVRDFYRFASQGQFDYVTDIYGPYTSKNNMRYYGTNSSIGGSDAHAVELCTEAMLNLPKDIDYSQYDNDGDGLIDNVHIIFAGYGEEAGASAEAIWSHEYPHRINLKSEIGFSLAGYSCTPELRGNRGTKISTIGVICHELGHALGAMDYYDTNYGTGGEYAGTGQWDIMASGSWNDDGRTPPNFNPYVRSEIFGWNKQIELESSKIISMPRMESDNAEQSVIYRLNTGSSGDYFLLENRQQYSFDVALPGSGLMVYHVHPNIERNSKTNTINATHPQGLYPVCASYSEPTRKKYGNINSDECPFPGSKNVRLFTATSIPAAIAWNGSSAKVSISSISINPADGSVSFTTSDEIVIEPDQTGTPTEKNLVYKEDFESNVNGKYSIATIMGKEKWRTYKKGNFVSNADLIPEASEASGIFMLFSGKDNSISESEAIGSNIKVEAGKNYFLSFDIYSESFANSPAPHFTMYVEDKYGEYNVYSSNMKTSEWQTIELPLVFADDMFNYKLYGRIQSGGIFIDNIRLFKEEELVSIKNIDFSIMESSSIYKLDGSLIGTFNNKPSNLQRSINIVKTKDGRTYKIISR